MGTEDRFPVYDPASDGNRFAWIIAAAERVRTQDRTALDANRKATRAISNAMLFGAQRESKATE